MDKVAETIDTKEKGKEKDKMLKMQERLDKEEKGRLQMMEKAAKARYLKRAKETQDTGSGSTEKKRNPT